MTVLYIGTLQGRLSRGKLEILDMRSLSSWSWQKTNNCHENGRHKSFHGGFWSFRHEVTPKLIKLIIVRVRIMFIRWWETSFILVGVVLLNLCYRSLSNGITSNNDVYLLKYLDKRNLRYQHRSIWMEIIFMSRLALTLR